MFQTNGGVGIEFCRKVERRTGCKMEVLNGCVRTDGIEDISEGLGGSGRDGEVD